MQLPLVKMLQKSLDSKLTHLLITSKIVKAKLIAQKKIYSRNRFKKNQISNCKKRLKTN